MKKLYHTLAALAFCASTHIISAQQAPPNFEFSCGAAFAPAEPPSNPPENFTPICPDPEDIKYLRVAVHFLLPGSIVFNNSLQSCAPPYSGIYYVGAGNFTENGDGKDPDYNGFLRAEEIVNRANEELELNSVQWRKDPNSYYPPDAPANVIRYLLAGTYFHRNAVAYNLYDPNNPSLSQSAIAYQTHNQYNIGGNEVIDVYYTPHGDWSGNAFDIGGSNKFVFNNDYWTYVTCRDWSLQYSASLLNHEIGHTLSLQHTWNETDGCNDTPRGFIYDRWYFNTNTNMWECLLNQNANCWRYDPGTPTCPQSTGGKPCDDWGKISNNVMDYNEYTPHAYTVCQIGRINAHLLTPNGNSYIHSCNGCLPSQAFLFMKDEYNLCNIAGPFPIQSRIELNGQGSFNENKYLIEICEVNLSQPDICLGLSYYSSGWQDGEVGIIDLTNIYNFSINRHYKIRLTVDNTDCPPSDVVEKIIFVDDDCTVEPEECCPPFEFAPRNPTDDNLLVYYSATEPGLLEMWLVNQFSGQMTTVLEETEVEAGDYQLQQSIAASPAGNYALVAQFNGQLYSKTIVKL